MKLHLLALFLLVSPRLGDVLDRLAAQPARSVEIETRSLPAVHPAPAAQPSPSAAAPSSSN